MLTLAQGASPPSWTPIHNDRIELNSIVEESITLKKQLTQGILPCSLEFLSLESKEFINLDWKKDVHLYLVIV
jgi:hypothetical protein